MSSLKGVRVSLTVLIVIALLSGLALAARPPKDPKNLDYSVITETSIELTWESGGGEDGFIVGYLEDVLPEPKCEGIDTEDVGTDTSYVVTDLTPGATYGFRVCAYNSSKTSDGATLLVTLGGSTTGYSMTVIPTLGGNRSWTLGMNNDGDVVGYSAREPGGGDYAFLYSGGGIIDLTDLPEVQADGWRLVYASDISDAGQIIGGGFLGEKPPYLGYRLTLGVGVENLGTLSGGTYAEPEAINDLGQVVGASDSSTGQHGFLWTEETGMVEISDDTYSTNRAAEINEAGQITGVMYPEGLSVPRAFRYTPGSGIEDLGAIKKPRGGVPWSRGTDINYFGEVVGSCSGAGLNNIRAFLYTNEISDVGVLEGDDRVEDYPANNDLGDIVGQSTTNDIFFPRAFLKTQGTMFDLYTLILNPPADLASVSLEPVDINNFGDICGMTFVVSGTTTYRRSFVLTLVPSGD